MITEKVKYMCEDTLKHISAVMQNLVRLSQNYQKDDYSFINLLNFESKGFKELIESTDDGLPTVISQVLHNIRLSEHSEDRLYETLSRMIQSHDFSKLDRHLEYPGYRDVVYKLSGLEYGTPEHTKAVAELDGPFEIHIQNNPHHPEYWESKSNKEPGDAVSKMGLWFFEMILDWTAAAVCRGFKFKRSSINRKKDELKLDDLTCEVIWRNIALMLPEELIEDDTTPKYPIKIFLGGTCNDSEWREELITSLETDYFNPVIKDWNEEAQKEEVKQKELCEVHLYTITPKMTGVFSIAEVVDSSYNTKVKTVLCILERDEDKVFNEFQMRSLKQVANIVESKGTKVFYNLDDLSTYLNSLIGR